MIELVRLSRAEALELREELPRITEFLSPTWAAEIFPRHAERDGFRFVAALVGNDVAGFTYGYLGAAGQWWHDIVSGAMSAQQRAHWLQPGHFEYTELHVASPHRRLGLGGRLHDALLDGLASRTAVLTTQVDNAPALALYAGRGWQLVLPEVDFGGGRLFSVLGKDLPSPVA